MAECLRLVSINTWKCAGDYGARMDVLERQLAALTPDVVALQESFASVDGRHDTAARLARHLGMGLAFLPERRKPRTVGSQSFDSHSGLAVLSRLPIAAEHHLPLPSNAADGGRSAQLLRLHWNGRQIVLGNIHLTHLDDGALRQQQLACLLKHPWLTAAADLALVCGDFNAGLDTPAMHAFLTPAGAWRDACASVPEKRTFRTAGASRDLDHILIRADSRLVETGAGIVLDAPDPVTGVLASDHCGVSASFR